MIKSEKNSLKERRDKLDKIKELGFDPYPHRYEVSHEVSELICEFSSASVEELKLKDVHVKTAGRVVSMRGHGKVGFSDLSGQGVKIQLYVREDKVGDENYRLYKLFDIGDIIGVSGKVFRTRMGELSLAVDRVHLLAKSLCPLPDKWHGLRDVERRFRQRYLDLIANSDVRHIFFRRGRIIREIREFFDEHGFLEVETPMMQPIAGGAAARPFKTFHEALGIPLYLRIAPELYLKRLTIGGIDRVYEVNRNFRNEGISIQHNPEFTMLEFYMTYVDYNDLMNFTEEMLTRVVERVTESSKVVFGDDVLDFGDFKRLSMVEAILKYWPNSINDPGKNHLDDRNFLIQSLKKLGENVEESASWGVLLVQLFEAIVEPRLIQPTFIYDYPKDTSPLAKTKKSDTRFVERFELYAGAFEIANAYSELNDPLEQEKRFEQQIQQKEKGNQEAHCLDKEYLRAMSYGLPPTGGFGLGIDRLTMLLTNRRSIREVIFFPQLRPEDGRNPEKEQA